RVCVCMHMYVCMLVCICIMYVCIYLSIYLSIYIYNVCVYMTESKTNNSNNVTMQRSNATSRTGTRLRAHRDAAHIHPHLQDVCMEKKKEQKRKEEEEKEDGKKKKKKTKRRSIRASRRSRTP